MAKWRKLYCKCTGSEKLALISSDAERLYWRLVASADDYGRFDASGTRLRLSALGALALKQPRYWTDKRVASCMSELSSVGLVRAYSVEGGSFGEVVGWSEKQRSRNGYKRQSSIPAPQTVENKQIAQQRTTAHNSAQQLTTEVDVDVEVEVEQSPIGDCLTRARGKDANDEDHVAYLEVLNLYNSICHTAGMPKAIGMQSGRKRSILARWKDLGGLEGVRTYFQRAAASRFLTTGNEKWGGADLTWLLNPTNMTKVLEGRYDDRRGGGRATPTDPTGVWDAIEEE